MLPMELFYASSTLSTCEHFQEYVLEEAYNSLMSMKVLLMWHGKGRVLY